MAERTDPVTIDVLGVLRALEAEYRVFCPPPRKGIFQLMRSHGR